MWATENGAGGCSGRINLQSTQMGEARKKNPVFLRKLNEHSENMGLNSKFVLVFEIWPFKIGN